MTDRKVQTAGDRYAAALRRIASELEGLGFATGPPRAASPPSPPQGLERMTKRERAIAAALVGGGDVAGIARQLGISEHTVRNHLKSARQKLSARSLTELVRMLGPHSRGLAT